MAFLAEYDLDEWVTIEYAETVVPLLPVDFIIWDFDKNPKRVDLMPAAFENFAVGGIMYVDDMHSSEIARASDALGGAIVSTVEADGFGRYGVFVRKTVADSAH